MKYILWLAVFLGATELYAQASEEAVVLTVSEKLFKWEVENNIDSLDQLWDEQFVVVGGAGDVQTKQQYLATLRSGNFVHNNIVVEENTARVANGTATVVGKGKFTVTISGNKVTLRLSYIEVYTKNREGRWKLLALHATVLPN